MKKNKTPDSSHLIYRIIDVNLNRAREGLRVIEDTIRFLKNDRKNFLIVRKIRHKLDNITKKIYPELLRNRESKSDVGRKVKDTKQNSTVSLLISNFKRAQEALRILEEYSRLISSNAGFKFKNIRYKLYTTEKNVYKKFFD